MCTYIYYIILSLSLVIEKGYFKFTIQRTLNKNNRVIYISINENTQQTVIS